MDEPTDPRGSRDPVTMAAVFSVVLLVLCWVVLGALLVLQSTNPTPEPLPELEVVGPEGAP